VPEELLVVNCHYTNHILEPERERPIVKRTDHLNDASWKWYIQGSSGHGKPK